MEKMLMCKLIMILLDVMEARVAAKDSITFQHLFWDQQVKATPSKSPSAMLWNTIMIKWCIYVCLLFPVADMKPCLNCPANPCC